jgi:hypothetical protein
LLIYWSLQAVVVQVETAQAVVELVVLDLSHLKAFQ